MRKALPLKIGELMRILGKEYEMMRFWEVEKGWDVVFNNDGHMTVVTVPASSKDGSIVDIADRIRDGR